MFLPSNSQSTEIESRVIPASGPVSRRSSPIKRLIRVDLPALGRPMTAMRIGLSGSSISSTKMSSDAARIALYRSAMPSPCSAEMATGSPKPRACASPTPPPLSRLSDLLASRMIGLCTLRRRSAKMRSSEVTPSRASIMNMISSASSRAASVCSRIRASRLSSVTSSYPAVSISVRSMSPMLPSAYRRSRVTPGRSSTSARRLPTRRLNRVDLPTLGRPTMATFRAMSAF